MNYLSSDISFLHHSLGATAPDIFPVKRASTSTRPNDTNRTTVRKETNKNTCQQQIRRDAKSSPAPIAPSSIPKVPSKKDHQKDKAFFEFTKKIQEQLKVKISISERLEEQLKVESLITDITSILLFEHARRIIKEGKICTNAKDIVLQRKQKDIEWLKRSLSVQSQSKEKELHEKQRVIDSLIQEKESIEKALKKEVEEKEMMAISKECAIATLKNKLSAKKNVNADAEAKYALLLSTKFETEETIEKQSIELEENYKLLKKKDFEIESIRNELIKETKSRDRIIHIKSCEVVSLTDKLSNQKNKVIEKDDIIQHQKKEIQSLKRKLSIEVDEKNEIIRSKEFEIESLKIELSEEVKTKDRLIQVEQNEMSSLREKLIAANTKLKEQDELLQAKTSEIQSLENKLVTELENKDIILKRKESTIESLHDELSKEVETKNELQHDIEILEDRCNKLVSKLEKKDRIVQNKKGQIESLKDKLESEIDDKNDIVERNERLIKSLEKKISQEEKSKNKLINSNKHKEASLENELSSLRSKLKERDQALHFKECELKELEESLSTEKLSTEVGKLLCEVAIEETKKANAHKVNELEQKLKEAYETISNKVDKIEGLTLKVNIVENALLNHQNEIEKSIDDEDSSLSNSDKNNSNVKPKKKAKNELKKEAIPPENRKFILKKDAINTLHNITSQIDTTMNNKDELYDDLFKFKQSIVKMTKNIEKCDVVGKDTFTTSISNIKTSLLRYGIKLDIREEWNDFEIEKEDDKEIEENESTMENPKLISKKDALDTLNKILSHIYHALKDKHIHHNDLLQFQKSIITMAKKIKKCDAVGKDTFTKSISNIKSALLRYGITVSNKKAIDTLQKILFLVDHALELEDHDGLLQLQGSLVKMMNSIENCDIIGRNTFITSLLNIKTSLMRYGITIDIDEWKEVDSKKSKTRNKRKEDEVIEGNQLNEKGKFRKNDNKKVVDGREVDNRLNKFNEHDQSQDKSKKNATKEEFDERSQDFNVMYDEIKEFLFGINNNIAIDVVMYDEMRDFLKFL